MTLCITMADVQSPPLPLSVATTVAVAAAAGAMGFVAVYWYTADTAQQPLSSPTQPDLIRSADGNGAGGRQWKTASWIGWPWTLRSRLREAAGAQWRITSSMSTCSRPDSRLLSFARDAYVLSTYCPA